MAYSYIFSTFLVLGSLILSCSRASDGKKPLPNSRSNQEGGPQVAEVRGKTLERRAPTRSSEAGNTFDPEIDEMIAAGEELEELEAIKGSLEPSSFRDNGSTTKEGEGNESTPTEGLSLPEDKPYLAIYMSDQGSDTKNGTTPEQAVSSFDRVKEIVQANLSKGKQIRILIEPGLYEGVHVRWPASLTMPDHKIIFMPRSDKLKFDSSNFVHFRANGSNKSSFLTVYRDTKSMPTRATNLVFFHLKIENYFAGLYFSGAVPAQADAIDADGALTHNEIIDCRFTKIGSLFYDGSSPAFKALGLNNSDHNKILYNHFAEIENSAEYGGVELIHGIYAAHNSSNNLIHENYFARNSGDPIKFRSFSNSNSVKSNIFVYSGRGALVNNWFRSHQFGVGKKKFETKGEFECPSWDNEIAYNSYNKTYYNPANRTSFARQRISVYDDIDREAHPSCGSIGDKGFSTRSNQYNGSPAELRSKTAPFASGRDDWVEKNLLDSSP